MRARLFPHSTHPLSPIDSIEARVERAGALLFVGFVASGHADDVICPPPRPPVRADELWKSTCFEVFVRSGESYVEYNLSPSRQWAAYQFAGYRLGMRRAMEVATVLGLDAGADYVALKAKLELPDNSARIALAAVIEDSRGEKTYWALAHPSDKPDFHHPNSFVLELP